jgi:hypothetical protein
VRKNLAHLGWHDLTRPDPIRLDPMCPNRANPDPSQLAVIWLRLCNNWQGLLRNVGDIANNFAQESPNKQIKIATNMNHLLVLL